MLVRYLVRYVKDERRGCIIVAFLTVNTNIGIYCDEASCSLVDLLHCFGEIYCLHIQGILINQFPPERSYLCT